MAKIARLVLAGAVVVFVVLGLGYAWGASGRGTLQTALTDAQQRLDIAEARGQVLEDAKAPLRRTRQRYVDAGNTDAVRSLSAALEHLDEAQRLAGKLEPAANTKAGEALEAIKVATFR
jgi:hypothetical protein